MPAVVPVGMERRRFLSTVGTGVVVAASGCIGDGRVLMDKSESVTVKPLDGWWEKLPEVGGDGALSVTVRADQKFQVFYFTSKGPLEQYTEYVGDDRGTETRREGTASATATARRQGSMPSGHGDISQAAVPVEDSNKYEVQVPDDGGRKSIDTDGNHYFVVDHSNYGMVPVEQFQEPLDAFVDLKVIESTSPL